MDNDIHPLDKPLGNLHECVWLLQLHAGHTSDPKSRAIIEWAAQTIAEAHEAIQNYVVEKDL